MADEQDPPIADRLATTAIVTQKTTPAQIETIKHRDQSYQVRKPVCLEDRSSIGLSLQRYNALLVQTRAAIDARYSEAAADLDRHRSYWHTSIDQLLHVNES